jgi:hypothetical protein
VVLCAADGLGFGLEPHLDTIEQCFSNVGSVEEVVEALKKVASDTALTTARRQFAQNLLSALDKCSPTSLKAFHFRSHLPPICCADGTHVLCCCVQVTFEQLRRGQYMTFADCLKMEYRMSQHFMVPPPASPALGVWQDVTCWCDRCV